ncbi:MAG TPA: HGxxPAAW family protein [Actinomycetales bacterium]|nr:HGxxPAAW family protein [Actinomycetales bacterium]
MAGEAHSNHGNTIAAWTGVGVIMIGSLIMAIAVVVTSLILFIIGGVVAILGVAAGKALSKAGYGAKRPDDTRVTRAVR